MGDQFLYNDLYNLKKKSLLKSTVVPLTCHVCKKELNGISIAAKIIEGKTVFLCTRHYQAKPYQMIVVE